MLRAVRAFAPGRGMPCRRRAMTWIKRFALLSCVFARPGKRLALAGLKQL
jgi:hypothetical protein